ncbi:MAG: hypothetical protein JWQ04_2329 [Pedosphaera sp.]|nr:hypothetical protein [Pedosphaera sp.]
MSDTMKTISGLFGQKLKIQAAGCIALACAAIMFSGCSTPQSVVRMEGHGARQVYDAGYDRVWSAAVAAAQQGDLQILEADKNHGYILAKRGVQPETFGENVAVWVRNVAPAQTEVEVVSRQAGPPVLVFRNWEHRILNSISANLTT